MASFASFSSFTTVSVLSHDTCASESSYCDADCMMGVISVKGYDYDCNPIPAHLGYVFPTASASSETSVENSIASGWYFIPASITPPILVNSDLTASISPLPQASFLIWEPGL